MSKTKLVLSILLILVAFVTGVFVGKLTESMKYHVALAGCEESRLPDEKYEIIGLDNSPTKQMFQNYYSPDLDLVELYVPENIDAKTYLETFGYGGFHYFKTSDGGVYQCGFYK